MRDAIRRGPLAFLPAPVAGGDVVVNGAVTPRGIAVEAERVVAGGVPGVCIGLCFGWIALRRSASLRC